MRIETERLILREFREEDWHTMAAYWSTPLHQRYYEPVPDRAAWVRELVDMLIAAQAEEPRLTRQLVVTLKGGDDRMIGNCGVRINDLDLAEGNIGYELRADMWGRGYATEAAGAMLAYGFNELGLHRIWAETVGENLGSQHVLTKLGMRREAQFREHQWYNDRWWDTLIYAMLDHEWRARKVGTR